MNEQVYKESRALLRMGMVHACGEGRRLWGEGGVFVPTVRTGGAENDRHSSLPGMTARSRRLAPTSEERDLAVLYKPFLAQDVVNLVRGRISKSRTAAVI